VAELEQAVRCGGELDRHAGGLLERQRVGHAVDRPGGRADQCGVAAVVARDDDAVAHGDTGRPLTGGDDRARRLVADDVRHAGERRAGPVQQITALDADGGDLDEDAAGAQLGVGHVFVAEDVRPAVLVVHRGLHGRLPTTA
jgi:hypothetical protein